MDWLSAIALGATLNRLAGPVLLPVLVLALGLVAYDAGERAAVAYRALHGAGRSGTFLVQECGARGCVGTFVSDQGQRRDAILEDHVVPAERVPAIMADGRAWPRDRSVWLYPGIVATTAIIGIAAVVAYGVVRPLRRRR